MRERTVALSSMIQCLQKPFETILEPSSKITFFTFSYPARAVRRRQAGGVWYSRYTGCGTQLDRDIYLRAPNVEPSPLSYVRAESTTHNPKSHDNFVQRGLTVLSSCCRNPSASDSNLATSDESLRCCAAAVPRSSSRDARADSVASRNEAISFWATSASSALFSMKIKFNECNKNCCCIQTMRK